MEYNYSRRKYTPSVPGGSPTLPMLCTSPVFTIFTSLNAGCTKRKKNVMLKNKSFIVPPKRRWKEPGNQKKKKDQKNGKKKKKIAQNPKTKPKIRSGLRRVCHVCRPPNKSVWVPGGHRGAAPASDPIPVLPRALFQRRACGTTTASP